jgi:restriction system protein
MREEHEKERHSHALRYQAEVKARAERNNLLEEVQRELCSLFGVPDPRQRGLLLEKLLNRLFALFDISVREAFVRREAEEGTAEQIDGVVELDGHLYLAEMKWLNGKVGVEDVARHLVRVYHRGCVRGMFFSASEFTPPSIGICHVHRVSTAYTSRSGMDDLQAENGMDSQ